MIVCGKCNDRASTVNDDMYTLHRYCSGCGHAGNMIEVSEAAVALYELANLFGTVTTTPDFMLDLIVNDHLSDTLITSGCRLEWDGATVAYFPFTYQGVYDAINELSRWIGLSMEQSWEEANKAKGTFSCHGRPLND